MKNLNFKLILSVVIIYSMMAAVTAKAAPIQFNQVIQVVNAKPGKANTGGFAQLRLVGDDLVLNGAKEGDDEPKAVTPPQQDDRVITETRAEIIEEDVCDCEVPVVGGGFPKYPLLGLAAIPFLFLIPPGNDGNTPTPTPTETPTTMTPTPPTEPVPEPMTILLFGTGLASIGLAARRKFGKKEEEETSAE